MVSIPEVVAEIMNINEETVPKWIATGLTSLTPNMLEQAIREWQDPLTIAEYLNLENIIVKNIAKRMILIPFWDRVEFTLKDQWELYNHISRNPAKKQILDTPRGKAWLEYVRARVFEYIYYYTWGRQCPACGKEMDRIKTEVKPKLISSMFGSQRKVAPITHEDYVCRGCGKTIPAMSTSIPVRRPAPPTTKRLYPNKIA